MISFILLTLSLAGGVFPQPNGCESPPPFAQGEDSTPTSWTAPVATYTLASSLSYEHPTPGTWPVVSTSVYHDGAGYGNPGDSYSYATTATESNAAGYLSGSVSASAASNASSTTTTEHASASQTGHGTTGDAAQLRSGVCVAMIIAVGAAALY